MAGIKSLAKETAVYGLSSIIGRFLNWCLVPLYVYLFPTEEYGIVSYLYSFTAVVLVILNYGMETGFFRFVNKEEDPDKVYSTTLISTATTSLLFIAGVSIALRPLSKALLLPHHSLYVELLAITVALDAFCNIPFAYLRYKKKAFRFAGIKLLNIFSNIFLNLFFLLLCPVLIKKCPGAISWFYTPAGGEDFGIGWIFVANIMSTLIVLAALLPYVGGRMLTFSWSLVKRMLSYSWPLLVLGVAGIMSQNMGQILIPYLFEGNEETARSMVGIYGANLKIAIVMVMFTQAFRYAYEPFIFSQANAKGEDRTAAYCDAMKFFVVFGLVIFLGVMYFLPVLKYFVSREYWSGLQVVPVMMAAELCFGVFFNLSLWYKLTDRTRWGMYFSLFGFAIMLVLNLWLVPMIGIPGGYMGSAWAALIGYFAMMVASWYVGRHYYPMPYPLKRMGGYLVLAVVLYLAGVGLLREAYMPLWLLYMARSVLLAGFVVVIGVYEDVPVLSGLLRRMKK